MKVKKSLVLALGLLITSCNTITPLYNKNKINSENKEFSIKLVSSSYMKSKLQSFIDLGNNPSRNSEAQKRVVRDINFYALEDQKNGNNYYRTLYHSINPSSIHSSVIAMNQVIAKRAIDPIFDAFLGTPNPTPTPSSTPTPTSTPTVPPAEDFNVTNSTQNNVSPDIASDANGNFVVVWQSDGGKDGSYSGVYAQRYNSIGTKQGSEFRVNTYTTGAQSDPSVSMNNDGDFIISWGSPDGSYSGVYAQRYNSNGIPVGSEFRANSYIPNNQLLPSVSLNDSGNFVIAWYGVGVGDGNGGTFVRRYDSNGVAQGNEICANTINAGYEGSPDVVLANDGNFVVTWDSYDVYAQRYNSNGVAQGSNFMVNTFTPSTQYTSSIDMDSNGNFTVAWSSYSQDHFSTWGIYAQKYNSSGVKQGSEFKVNTYVIGTQYQPSISMNNNGAFVVSWSGQNSDGTEEIHAKRYDSLGVVQGSEFRVNTYTTGTQAFPVSSIDSNGNFVIVWQSQKSSIVIDAQRYNSDGTVR